MTSPPAREPRRRVRRGALIVGVTLLVACLAVWLFAPALLVAPSRPVRWQLASGFGEALDRTSTVIPVYMDEWPAEFCPRAGDWLATPLVTETPWSVVITMHTSTSFDTSACSGWYDFWGTPIEVQLIAPLAGRALFDGSTVPPAPRGYP
jgi:hypothetical protein